ncbi:hypothetical protein [Hoeflea sp.]|uniref:hypothetical protein n=1 Tax=Hoeflea sp. TaxID=1940281 RepID=UPI003B51FEFE
MSDLEYHYETIGRILDFLVSNGLRRFGLESSDAMEIMTHRIGDEEEVLATFNDVLHWMLDEGLIRCSSVQDGGYCDYFNGTQLTSKGIAIIQSKVQIEGLPGNVQDTLSQGDRGSLTGEVYQKIGSFVGGAAGGFLQSFG